MSKTTEPLNSNKLAEKNVLLTNRIENGYASAQDRSIFYRINVSRNPHHRFRSQQYVFRIPTIHRDTIDSFMLANLKQTPLAGLACMIMT
jgi:hypothetical protein